MENKYLLKTGDFIVISGYDQYEDENPHLQYGIVVDRECDLLRVRILGESRVKNIYLAFHNFEYWNILEDKDD
jgi:hypothetical protein